MEEPAKSTYFPVLKNDVTKLADRSTKIVDETEKASYNSSKGRKGETWRKFGFLPGFTPDLEGSVWAASLLH